MEHYTPIKCINTGVHTHPHTFTNTHTHTQDIIPSHLKVYWILILITDQCTDILPSGDTSETIDDNSNEQSTGEMDEERIETEIITYSNLLELVNNLFT